MNRLFQKLLDNNPKYRVLLEEIKRELEERRKKLWELPPPGEGLKWETIRDGQGKTVRWVRVLKNPDAEMNSFEHEVDRAKTPIGKLTPENVATKSNEQLAKAVEEVQQRFSRVQDTAQDHKGVEVLSLLQVIPKGIDKIGLGIFSAGEKLPPEKWISAYKFVVRQLDQLERLCAKATEVKESRQVREEKMRVKNRNGHTVWINSENLNKTDGQGRLYTIIPPDVLASMDAKAKPKGAKVEGARGKYKEKETDEQKQERHQTKGPGRVLLKSSGEGKSNNYVIATPSHPEYESGRGIVIPDDMTNGEVYKLLGLIGDKSTDDASIFEAFKENIQNRIASAREYIKSPEVDDEEKQEVLNRIQKHEGFLEQMQLRDPKFGSGERIPAILNYKTDKHNIGTIVNIGRNSLQKKTELLDDDGKPVLDEKGEPIMVSMYLPMPDGEIEKEPMKGADGKPVIDPETGKPVMVAKMVPEKDSNGKVLKLPNGQTRMIPVVTPTGEKPKDATKNFGVEQIVKQFKKGQEAENEVPAAETETTANQGKVPADTANAVTGTNATANQGNNPPTAAASKPPVTPMSETGATPPKTGTTPKTGTSPTVAKTTTPPVAETPTGTPAGTPAETPKGTGGGDTGSSVVQTPSGDVKNTPTPEKPKETAVAGEATRVEPTAQGKAPDIDYHSPAHIDLIKAHTADYIEHIVGNKKIAEAIRSGEGWIIKRGGKFFYKMWKTPEMKRLKSEEFKQMISDANMHAMKQAGSHYSRQQTDPNGSTEPKLKMQIAAGNIKKIREFLSDQGFADFANQIQFNPKTSRLMVSGSVPAELREDPKFEAAIQRIRQALKNNSTKQDPKPKEETPEVQTPPTEVNAETETTPASEEPSDGTPATPDAKAPVSPPIGVDGEPKAVSASDATAPKNPTVSATPNGKDTAPSVEVGTEVSGDTPSIAPAPTTPLKDDPERNNRKKTVDEFQKQHLADVLKAHGLDVPSEELSKEQKKKVKQLTTAVTSAYGGDPKLGKHIDGIDMISDEDVKKQLAKIKDNFDTDRRYQPLTTKEPLAKEPTPETQVSPTPAPEVSGTLVQDQTPDVQPNADEDDEEFGHDHLKSLLEPDPEETPDVSPQVAPKPTPEPQPEVKDEDTPTPEVAPTKGAAAVDTETPEPAKNKVKGRGKGSRSRKPVTPESASATLEGLGVAPEVKNKIVDMISQQDSEQPETPLPDAAKANPTQAGSEVSRPEWKNLPHAGNNEPINGTNNYRPEEQKKMIGNLNAYDHAYQDAFNKLKEIGTNKRRAEKLAHDQALKEFGLDDNADDAAREAAESAFRDASHLAGRKTGIGIKPIDETAQLLRKAKKKDETPKQSEEIQAPPQAETETVKDVEKLPQSSGGNQVVHGRPGKEKEDAELINFLNDYDKEFLKRTKSKKRGLSQNELEDIHNDILDALGKTDLYFAQATKVAGRTDAMGPPQFTEEAKKILDDRKKKSDAEQPSDLKSDTPPEEINQELEDTVPPEELKVEEEPLETPTVATPTPTPTTPVTPEKPAVVANPVETPTPETEPVAEKPAKPVAPPDPKNVSNPSPPKTKTPPVLSKKVETEDDEDDDDSGEDDVISDEEKAELEKNRRQSDMYDKVMRERINTRGGDTSHESVMAEVKKRLESSGAKKTDAKSVPDSSNANPTASERKKRFNAYMKAFQENMASGKHKSIDDIHEATMKQLGFTDADIAMTPDSSAADLGGSWSDAELEEPLTGSPEPSDLDSLSEDGDTELPPRVPPKPEVPRSTKPVDPPKSKTKQSGKPPAPSRKKKSS